MEIPDPEEAGLEHITEYFFLEHKPDAINYIVLAISCRLINPCKIYYLPKLDKLAKDKGNSWGSNYSRLRITGQSSVFLHGSRM